MKKIRSRNTQSIPRRCRRHEPFAIFTFNRNEVHRKFPFGLYVVSPLRSRIRVGIDLGSIHTIWACATTRYSIFYSRKQFNLWVPVWLRMFTSPSLQTWVVDANVPPFVRKNDISFIRLLALEHLRVHEVTRVPLLVKIAYQ